jgi:hypothetical protein
LFADFHALWHSFVALLDRPGATLKEAMQLARHSNPRLTMAVYGRAQLHDLAGAVDRLPSLTGKPLPQVLAATGTDSAPLSACSPLAVASDGKRGKPMVSEGAAPETEPPSACRNSSPGKGAEGNRGQLMASEGSAPRRTRTWNPLIKRHFYRPSCRHQKALLIHTLQLSAAICKVVRLLT